MKRRMLFLLCLVFCVALSAQEKMYIHKSDKITLGALISETDSVFFSSDGSMVYFRIGDTLAQYPVSDIDSISFGDNSNSIIVTYNGSTASIINPLAFEGVYVAVDKANVTVKSTTETRDINYILSGTTTDGTFKIYSEKRFNLMLNGVAIVNPDGPAVNIQSNNKVSVTLADGTTNTLSDGSTYADPPNSSDGEPEDQDAAFFSEGKMVIAGTGSLTINGFGLNKHALCSDDLIEIDGGTITVSGAANDGIHANDGIVVTDGTINVTATGDAIDGDKGYVLISGGSITTNNSTADVQGISCDSTLVISGGTINMTLSGNQSKGIKSGQYMILNGGNIAINASGSVVLEPSGLGYNPSYCTGIRCDTTITLNGTNVTITSSGLAGKGISSDDNINITAGTIKITTSGGGRTYKDSGGITDACYATCITADGNISITGGSVSVSNSGSGGRGITSNGTMTFGDSNNSPAVDITTSGIKFLVSTGDYAEPKAVKSDGTITINNGTIIISSNDDALKSEVSITINMGTVSIIKSVEGIESPYITVNGGNVSIVATNDGFNATQGGGGEGNDGSCLYIYGGYIVTNVSNGDGLDSNGNIVMSAGTVIVHGPQAQPEVGMDFNGTFNISGGYLVVSGTNSNMTEGPSSSSSQYSVIAKASVSLSSSTLFHIQDATGNNIVTFQPVRSYYSMIFSSSSLKNGSTYYIYTGGSSTGTFSDGLYTGGTYSGGTLKKSFIISNKVTNVSF